MKENKLETIKKYFVAITKRYSTLKKYKNFVALENSDSAITFNNQIF